MGTILTVRIEGEDSGRMERLFADEVQRLEELLSIYRTSSEITRINRAAGIAPVRVSTETYTVIEEALHYAALSSGTFDPTAGSSADYHKVLLNPDNRTVFLEAPGMRLDLGGIGKGFALDRALARVREAGAIESVSADFGGQLFFWHKDGSFAPETILIEDRQPFTFQIDTNGSISTSSNAERPGHLLDPRSGRPAEGVDSVTVSAPTSTQAEALSTAVFIMGKEAGEAWLSQFPGVRAFIF
jgi:thiamine biosynthesis lipoprotein